MIKKQFTLYLPNRRGELANVTKKLANAGINIEGISVSASTDVALVQIVTSKSGKAGDILRRGRIPFTAQDVAVLPLKNRPGELYRSVEKLAEAGININYIYATACSCPQDCNCLAIVSAPDLKKVVAAW